MSTDPALQYFTGEDIKPGDRIQYNGTYGRVVFLSDGTFEQYEPGFEEYIGSGRGVIVCDDDGAITPTGEPDERLAFIDRG